jgi:putative transposon-encoded protein
MKRMLFALTLVVFGCAVSVNAQNPAPVLPGSVIGVNATNNVTENVSLNRGFVLSGTITGDSSSTPDSVTALSPTMTVGFGATINQTTHRYRIELAAGTYQINVSFSRSSGLATTSFSYVDSTALTVSADTDHNITLPTVSTSSVTGNVTNLIVTSPIHSLAFDSTSIPGFIDVAADSSLDMTGNYSVILPNGSYSVELSQEVLSPASFFTDFSTALGTVAVGGTTTANFAAPTIGTADLSGTITITGSSAIPANTLVSAADSTTPVPTTVSDSSGLLPSTGAYDFLLGTGEKYIVGVDMSVVLLPSPAPQGLWTPPDPSPLTGPLAGPTVHNITLPAIPANAIPHAISGRVTIAGSGAPVPGATVFAGSTSLSVAPNTSFDQSATTDSNGNYSMTVAAGSYDLFVDAKRATTGDFDGDDMANIAVWRPSNGDWFIISNLAASGSSLPLLNSTKSRLRRPGLIGSGRPNLSPTGPKVASSNATSLLVEQWGASGDIPVPGDYDGDRKADVAVFRPSNGTWYIVPSSHPSAPIVQQWGASGDIPVPGDYDGDGKTDFAVFRPSNGVWYIIPSSNPGTLMIRQWGASGDIPVPGDYDGDRKTDIAVFRPSNGVWYIMPSSNPGVPIIRQWGAQGDMPVEGDYDGDGITDIAVFRPSNGTWFVIPSGSPSSPIVQQWGANGDIPVPADYDGDQIADIAVWRPSNGTWYIIPSSTPSNFTVTQWGSSTDVAVQKPIGQ